MSFEPPNNDLIREAFPQIESVELIDKGGFKAVYRIAAHGKVETLKLLLIPSHAGSPDADALRLESIGRGSALETEIDPLVSALYALTPEEIQIVEGASK